MANLDRIRPHHTPSGFRNRHPHAKHGILELLRWQWERLLRRPAPRTDVATFTIAPNDPSYLKVNNHETTVTWIGHSTLLVQVAGINILTDPHLSERASPLRWAGPKRSVPPGLGFAQLPVVHLMLLSHNHYDHLDLSTMKWFGRQPDQQQPLTVVPLGLKPFIAGQGLTKVVELDWWQQTEFGDALVHAVPAQHFSARTPFDRNQTLWAGYVVKHPMFRFLFAGDTGYSADFKIIGEEFGPIDLAAIPIGAYEPRWFMRAMHVNPEEAVRIHQDVRARRSVAIHWGTFGLTDEPLDEPPKRLTKALAQAGISPEEFFVMQHGETRRLGTPKAKPANFRSDLKSVPSRLGSRKHSKLTSHE